METHMDEPCDICGDVGVIDAICTCYVCKISRQHTYCMKNFSLDIPMFWRCEECEHSSETKSGLKEDLPKAPMFNSSGTANKNANNSGSVIKHPTHPGQSRSYREKWVVKGKTKYIPYREAITLSSGSKKLDPPLKTSPRSGPGTLKPIPTICERSSSRPKVISPKITSPRVKENPTFGVLGRSKSPPDVKIDPVAQPSVVQSLTERKENKAARHSKNAATQIRQPLDGVKSPKNVESANTETEMELGKASSFSTHGSLGPPLSISGKSPPPTISGKSPPPSISGKSPPPSITGKLPSPTISGKSPPPTISGGNVCENVEQRSSNAEERSQIVIVPEIETYSQILPSRHAYWKGSFELPNGLKHLELNNRFNAHPPSKLRLRIYELLKKMPEVLDFELVPRFNVLTDIFKDSCPVKDDIGLYFFPGNNKSSENYTSLLEFMWAEKLVLKSYLNGVELFVLTSRVLQPDFQQWHGIYYFWGVFRRVKKMANNHASRDNDKQHSAIVQPPSGNQASHVGPCEVEDMDIDPVNVSDLGCMASQPRSKIPPPPPGFENLDIDPVNVSDLGCMASQPRSKIPPPPPGFENDLSCMASQPWSKIPPPPPGFENSPRWSGIPAVPPPPGFENFPRPSIKTEVAL